MPGLPYHLQVKELEAAGERLQAALSEASSSLAPLEAERDRLAAQREEARAAMAAQVAEADKEVRCQAGGHSRTAPQSRAFPGACLGARMSVQSAQ